MADIDDSTNWFEVDGSNTEAPPNGWPAGMFPNQVEPTAQALMGAIKRWFNRISGVYSSTVPSGVEYSVTPTNTTYPAAWVQGERFVFKVNAASQGNDTFSWNGLTAVPIYKNTGGALVQLAAGDLIAGQFAEVMYDGALNGGAGGVQLLALPPTTPPTASQLWQTGDLKDTTALTLPTGWAYANGQALNRTGAAAALFAATTTTFNGDVTNGSPIVTSLVNNTNTIQVGWYISGTGVAVGTTVLSIDSASQIHMSANATAGSGGAVALTFGPNPLGDGVTTFNVIDLMNRATVGMDGMGGVALSNRITTATAGMNGAKLGAVGGDQRLYQHNHGVIDPSHTHSTNVTDNGWPVMVNILGSAGTETPGGANLQLVELVVDEAATGITIANAGAGASQNVQPTAVVYKIIKL